MALRDVRTLSDAIDSGTPALATIRKTNGDKYVSAYLKMWIIYFQSMLNVKNKLTEDMIDLLAENILSSYWYLTIADIKNVFVWALNGVYGEFYEAVSIPKVMKWFEDYTEKRFEVCEQRSINRHMEIKNTPIVEEDLERIKLKALRDGRKTFATNKRRNKG